MKNLLYILLLIPFGILAQTPQGFKYQAVIRTASGSLVTNQQVAIKTSLISGSALGNVDYSEQHDVATNGYGVASFTIGGGTPITGTYTAVNWSANDYFLKTELDIQNNGNFQLMGTSQILSVPYASHANTATTTLTDNDTSSNNEIQQLSLQGNQLILSSGGSVTLTGTVDLDADPSNELQTLSLSNDTLYLTNGNYVVIADYLQSLSSTLGSITLSNSNTITLADSSASNEIQTLSNTNGTISISGSNTITLSDSSATNELQTLSQTAGSISISNGNTITLLDSSATNELQSLSLVGQDSLMITNGNTVKIPSLDNSETNEIQMLSNTPGTISLSSANTIVLADSSANNEIQMLSNTAGTISISSANTIVLEDSSSTNEIQNLSIIGDSLSISDGNSVVIPDEVPTGTIVFSESSDDTELISRNYELIGAEIKNVALANSSSVSTDTNYYLNWSSFTSLNYSNNYYFSDAVSNINPISFVKNDKLYIITNSNTTGNSQIVDLNNLSVSSMNVGSYMEKASFLWTGNDLYKFGGRTGSQWSTSMHNSLEKYDFSSDSWIILSSTNAPTPRCDASMLWIGDKLIVFGGMELYGYYTKAYKKSDGGIYDPVSDSWSSIPAPTSTGFAASNRHAIVWTGSEMIVWGGFTSTNSSNYFTSPQSVGARYDPLTNTWNNLANPPSSFSARGNSVYCWTGSKMLIFGGLYNQYTYSYYIDGQLYDPSTDTWTSLPSNPTIVQGYSRSFISNSKELILGGFSNSNSNRSYSAVWKYNFTDNSWVNSPHYGEWDTSGEYWLDAPTAQIGPSAGVMSFCQKDSNSYYVVDTKGNIKYLSSEVLIGKSLNMDNILQNIYYMYRKK